MSRPLQLFNLQKIDTKIDTARSRLKEIEIALNDDATVVKAQKETDAAEEVHKTANKKLKRTEEEVQSQQEKIEKNQKITYSGSVTNPKELEDLQNESEALNRFLAVLEDRQLEKMIISETAELAFQHKQANLETVTTQASQDNVALAKEQKELLEKAEGFENDREQAVSIIDPEDLNEYSKLREKHRGIAVAEVKNKSCSACGGTLSASKAQNARSPNNITNCENCKRILYSK